jgi:hypothetical protein
MYILIVHSLFSSTPDRFARSACDLNANCETRYSLSLHLSENTAPKGKCVCEKNPRKKKGKKATVSRKNRSWSDDEDICQAVTTTITTTPAAKRRPLQALQANIPARSPTESPDVLAPTINRFAALAMMQSDIERSSPTPQKKVVATPVPNKKIFKRRNFLDALEGFGDLSYVEFMDFPVFEFSLPVATVEDVPVVEDEVVVVDAVAEVDVPAAEHEQPVERKPDGFFMKSLRFLGKVVARVASIALTAARIVRGCF